MPDNSFNLITQGTNTNGQITSIHHYDNQPTNYGDNILIYSNDSVRWYFIWDIPRNGHNYIADQFNQFCENDSIHAFTFFNGSKGNDTLPTELNLLIYCYVTFKSGDQFSVAVAQGHANTGENNWWVGSPSIQWDNTNYLHYFPLNDGSHSSLSSNGSDSVYYLTDNN